MAASSYFVFLERLQANTWILYTSHTWGSVSQTVNSTQMKAYRSNTWRIKSHIHNRLEGYQGRTFAALAHSGSRSDLGSVAHGCITAEFPCGVSASCYRCFIEHEKNPFPRQEISTYLWLFLPLTLRLHDKNILKCKWILFYYHLDRTLEQTPPESIAKGVWGSQEFTPAGTFLSTFFLHPSLINNM